MGIPGVPGIEDEHQKRNRNGKCDKGDYRFVCVCVCMMCITLIEDKQGYKEHYAHSLECELGILFARAPSTGDPKNCSLFTQYSAECCLIR